MCLPRVNCHSFVGLGVIIMHRNKLILLVLAMLVCIHVLVVPVQAEKYAGNTDTGYAVYIEDGADLLSEEEEQELVAHMQPVTMYGDVLFITVEENEASADELVRSIYTERFAPGESIVFLIDMENREMRIGGGGELKSVITSGVANTITDNTYLYATNGDYATCANETFDQICIKLEGGKIAQPLKYISNALAALVVAFIINYAIVRAVSAMNKGSQKAMEEGVVGHCTIKAPYAEFIRTYQSYNPQDTSGGSSGRSHIGGRSSLGGGSSRGGFGGRSSGRGSSSGGHRF